MSREVIPKLVGTRKLIYFHIKDSSGQTAYPFGKEAQGGLIYEPDGHMAFQLMNSDRSRFEMLKKVLWMAALSVPRTKRMLRWNIRNLNLEDLR